METAGDVITCGARSKLNGQQERPATCNVLITIIQRLFFHLSLLPRILLHNEPEKKLVGKCKP